MVNAVDEAEAADALPQEEVPTEPATSPRPRMVEVFCLLGLTKVMFMSNISDTTTPSLPLTPKDNTEIATLSDTMRHYFARFCLKIPSDTKTLRTKYFLIDHRESFS